MNTYILGLIKLNDFTYFLEYFKNKRGLTGINFDIEEAWGKR